MTLETAFQTVFENPDVVSLFAQQGRMLLPPELQKASCTLTMLQCELKVVETEKKEENFEKLFKKRKCRTRLESYIVRTAETPAFGVEITATTLCGCGFDYVFAF